MSEDIGEKIYKILIEFAEKNPEIKSIYKGHDLGEFYNYTSYYVFRKKGKYTRELKSKMAELNKKLVSIIENTSVICSAVGPSRFKKKLLEKVIYKRD